MHSYDFEMDTEKQRQRRRVVSEPDLAKGLVPRLLDATMRG